MPSYARLTTAAVIRSRSLLFATVLLFLAPVVGTAIAIAPFAAIGLIAGGLGVLLFTGLLVAYPAACAATSIATAAVVAASAGDSDRDDVLAAVRENAAVLGKWGIVTGLFGPFVRIANAVGAAGNTALNDTLYMGMRATFYAPEVVVLDDEHVETVQEVFQTSATRFQTFHDDAAPRTRIGFRARLIGGAAIGLAVLGGLLLPVVSWLQAAVGGAVAVVVVYLLVKHVAHTLLYLYNHRGEPDGSTPDSQLTPDLYTAAFPFRED